MEVNLGTLFRNKFIVSILLVTAFLLLTFQELVSYIQWDFHFLLLMIALPFVLQKQSDQKSIRYGIVAIILLLLFPILKTRSVFFFAFICTLLFVYESQFGKLSSIPLFLVVVISPVAIFFSEVIGFEIRLWLTEIAASILQYIDGDYSYSGNIILIGENEFHVDSECMGLNMVLMSLFIALIFISYQQRTKKRQVSLFWIVVTLILTYILSIISNLFRIIILSIFQSPPETFSHEFIGLLCFVCYVVIPLWFVIKFIPTQDTKEKEQTIVPSKKRIFNSLTVVLFSFFTLYYFIDVGSKDTLNPHAISLDYFVQDFNSSVEKHNVIKLTNEDYLIYIKPAASFYSADHSPIICWQGSGYEVMKEQIISTPSKDVYYCELKKDEDLLYSTWWYDSGKDKTIQQYRWRFKNLIHGDRYHLVNVISDSKDNLMTKTNALIAATIFDEKP